MTLKSYVESVATDLEEVAARSFGLKIAQTLSYLHERGVFIRNLDYTSFLMSESTKEGEIEGALMRMSRLSKAMVMG